MSFLRSLNIPALFLQERALEGSAREFLRLQYFGEFIILVALKQSNELFQGPEGGL